MTADMEERLLEGSIGASLQALDSSSRAGAEASVGPFRILTLDSSTEAGAASPGGRHATLRPPAVALHDAVEQTDHSQLAISDEDALLGSAHQHELLSAVNHTIDHPEDEPMMPSFDTFQDMNYLDSFLPFDDGLQWVDLFDFGMTDIPSVSQPGIPSEGASDIASNAIDDLLSTSQPLLAYYKDHVMPLLTYQQRAKSSWSTAVLPAAVHTLAQLTYLNGESNNAQKATLYAVLATAAYHQADNLHHAGLLAEQAQRCLHKSLKHEKQQAKYKDQLMAILSIIAYGTVSGKLADARNYITQAERLIRTRGLVKTSFSRRARMLHHVYTWLRILGESAYVPLDYANVVQALKGREHSGQHQRRIQGQSHDLDDFLDMPDQQGHQDLQIEQIKDQQESLRDLHLLDSRQNLDTLYTRFFGVSETWLSLIAQTTRLANCLGAITYGAIKDQAICDALEQRTHLLEDMVCSFVQRFPRSDTMHDALNAALMILFYRRIRSVNSWVLQGHVSDILTILQKYEDASELTSAATVWPAFLAGCEAMVAEKRQWLLGWFERASTRTGLDTFNAAKEIIVEVWRRKELSLTASQQVSRTYNTWIDVVRERQFWLIACG